MAKLNEIENELHKLDVRMAKLETLLTNHIAHLTFWMKILFPALLSALVGFALKFFH